MVELEIRPAGAGDAEGIARVHAAAWRAAFTFLPSRFLEGMTVGAVLGKWQGDLLRPTTSEFVAISDRSVVAFLQVRADGPEGEVMALYVDPARWGEGVGSGLLAFGEAWLAAHGVGTAALWTAKESLQSRVFYERRGWAVSGHEQTQHLGPTDVALEEVEYRKLLV